MSVGGFLLLLLLLLLLVALGFVLSSDKGQKIFNKLMEKLGLDDEL